MTGKKASQAITSERVDAMLIIYENTDRNVTKTAKELNVSPRMVRHLLAVAENLGKLVKEDKTNEPIHSRWRSFAEVRDARKNEFNRVQAAGDGRTPHVVKLKDSKPFCLVPIGDPHLDSPGTDLSLFEWWTSALDHEEGMYGIALGDWLDNWPRPLAHLYSNSETPAPEGYVLLEGYLKEIGEDLIASVSGNHDDWAGQHDVLGFLMRQQNVLHRNLSLRISIETPQGHKVTVGIRHRFSGNSQWNAAHAIMKVAQLGWRDTVLIGGDKHISGQGVVRSPDDGKLTWCFQVAAFKVNDNYGDQLGLMDKHISPGVALVIDPTRSDNDPQRVTAFYNPHSAKEYLRFLRNG